MNRPPETPGRASTPPAWLPNAITVLRIALIPAFLYHASQCAGAVDAGEGDQPQRALAVAAFLGIGISDVVDGWLARRYGLATPLGAVLDAVADKLAQVSLLTFFLVTDSAAFAGIPLWFFVMIVGRDVILGLGSLLVRKRRGDVAVVHEIHGKLASALLFVLLLGITLDLAWRAWAGPLMTLTTLVVVLSTWVYVRAGWRQYQTTQDGGSSE